MFLRGVYGWMCAALAITALTAWIVAASPSLAYAVTTSRLLLWGLVIAQLGIVLALSAHVQQLAPATASALFIVYSMLTGVTISVLLLVLTRESAAETFVGTAGKCGGLVTYGSVTHPT